MNKRQLGSAFGLLYFVKGTTLYSTILSSEHTIYDQTMTTSTVSAHHHAKIYEIKQPLLSHSYMSLPMALIHFIYSKNFVWLDQ